MGQKNTIQYVFWKEEDNPSLMITSISIDYKYICNAFANILFNKDMNH